MMPMHASHLLRTLNVGCFAVLKRSYGSRVAGYTRLGINPIKTTLLISSLKPVVMHLRGYYS
jgi:hypothetical protein